MPLEKNTNQYLKQFQIDNVKIDREDCVKLLVLDLLLNFDVHVTRMCKKAADQL